MNHCSYVLAVDVEMPENSVFFLHLPLATWYGLCKSAAQGVVLMKRQLMIYGGIAHFTSLRYEAENEFLKKETK